MSLRFLILSLSYYYIISACQPNSLDCKKIKANHINDSLVFKVDTAINKISFNHYTLVVKTLYNKDSVSVDEPNLFNPICFSQELIFMFKDSITKRILQSVKKIKQKTYNGRELLMLENVITDIGIVIGKKGVLFAINGYGGCNSCSEYYGLYSLDGNLLFYSYGTTYNKFDSMGNLEDVLKQFGIDDTIYLQQTYKKVDVYWALSPFAGAR